MKQENGKMKKTEKMPKPFEKFIWLFASVIIAVVGYFLRTSDVQLNLIAKTIFAAFLLFTIIMAAQKTSVERFSFAKDEENGIEGDKKKYILSSLVYYLFDIIAVFYIFYSLWVCRVFSV